LTRQRGAHDTIGVRIAFHVGDKPAEFRRNGNTGKAELRVGGEVLLLQSPLSLTAHFDFRTRNEWRRTLHDHEVAIVKIRPRVLGGVRENTYTVEVDGKVVATARGK